MSLEGEPISPELVLVSPELRRLALQQLVEAAEQAQRALPAPQAADPLPRDDVEVAVERSPERRRGQVLGAAVSRARKIGKVIVFCAVEVVIVVAAVLLVKVIAG